MSVCTDGLKCITGALAEALLKVRNSASAGVHLNIVDRLSGATFKMYIYINAMRK